MTQERCRYELSHEDVFAALAAWAYEHLKIPPDTPIQIDIEASDKKLDVSVTWDDD